MIPHLSLSVADLAASEDFYRNVLDARVGRRTPGWIDVWVFGVQLTLHLRPKAVVPSPHREAMHFGATVDWSAWPGWLDRLQQAGAAMAAAPFRDESAAKAYVLDPDGYVIEIKAYADPSASQPPHDGTVAAP